MSESQISLNDEYEQSMLIIASTWGHTLVFQTLEDFKRFVQQMNGMWDWIEENDIKPPYLFHHGDGRIPTEELDQWTDWVKWTIEQGQGKE